MRSVQRVRAGVCAATVMLVTACAPGSYAVRNPAPSGIAFSQAQPESQLVFVDSRSGSDRVFFSGTLPVTLTLDGSPVDPAGYLSKNLQAELSSRGVPTQVTQSGETFPRLDLKTFRMQNHRTNAYTPFVSFTFVSGELETATGKQRLGVFVKRGKVPVWSFDEIIEPTLNEPLSLAVKELSTKIAGRLYGARSNDAEVDRLVAKLGKRSDASYLDVYALGFTNNARAVPTLVALAKDDDEYVRIAAISSLGTLGANDQLELLKSIASSGNLWQDRAMALKAIGDLGSPEAQAYLNEQRTALQAKGDKEATWSMQVINLYM